MAAFQALRPPDLMQADASSRSEEANWSFIAKIVDRGVAGSQPR